MSLSFLRRNDDKLYRWMGAWPTCDEAGWSVTVQEATSEKGRRKGKRSRHNTTSFAPAAADPTSNELSHRRLH